MLKGGDSVKRLFRKFRKEKRIVPQMPEWNEIVEMLYDKNLDCMFLIYIYYFKEFNLSFTTESICL